MRRAVGGTTSRSASGIAISSLPMRAAFGLPLLAGIVNPGRVGHTWCRANVRRTFPRTSALSILIQKMSFVCQFRGSLQTTHGPWQAAAVRRLATAGEPAPLLERHWAAEAAFRFCRGQCLWAARGTVLREANCTRRGSCCDTYRWRSGGSRCS